MPTELVRTRNSSWLAVGLVAAPTVLILVTMLGILNLDGSGGLLQFPDLLRANTPTGGDLGAHVLLPRILEDSVLPSLRVLGWSDAWFAGFPVLYLYFPVPMLAVVLADVFLPYGVAFKIVVAGGLVALPTATFFLVRWVGFDRIVAGVAATSGGAFVFMESYAIYGGNIKSTLVGEFSFSWSLLLAALYVGLVTRQARLKSGFNLWPGILLGFAALSHVVSAVVAVCAGGVLLIRRSAVRPVLMSWLVGFGIAAFWAVPFGVYALTGLSPDTGWIPVTGFIGDDSPMPGELVPIAIVALAGVIATLRRRDSVGPILGMMVTPLGLYFFLPIAGVTHLNNARFLPYWYFGVFVLAGIGLGLGAGALGKTGNSGRHATGLGSVLATVILLGGAVAMMSEVPSWVHAAFAGYEGNPAYPEYEALMDRIDDLPPGRVVWEYNPGIADYGTPLALMLTPYWSETHPSMQGLYYESSLTTPFNFLNESEISLSPTRRISDLKYHRMDFDRATRHLGLYDVKYYVSYTDEAENAALEFGLDPIAVSRPWVIFDLPRSDAIDVAAFEPAVWAGSGDFSDAALAWYDDIDHLDRWLVAAGPDSWKRIDSLDDRTSTPATTYSTDASPVTNVSIQDDRISFDTTAIGVPHLVKVSYFPNWRVEGAEGPYRAAPSLMIVVPTSGSVVMTFGRTWYEIVGMWISILSILAMALWTYRRSRSRRRGRSAEQVVGR